MASRTFFNRPPWIRRASNILMGYFGGKGEKGAEPRIQMQRRQLHFIVVKLLSLLTPVSFQDEDPGTQTQDPPVRSGRAASGRSWNIMHGGRCARAHQG